MLRKGDLVYLPLLDLAGVVHRIHKAKFAIIVSVIIDSYLTVQSDIEFVEKIEPQKPLNNESKEHQKAAGLIF
jgi:hypothetical protein